MRFLLVILRQPFANLGHGAPHHVVGRSVIVGRSMEHLNADRPFLEPIATPLQRLIHNELQYGGITPAVVKSVAFKNLFQLLPNLFPLQICLGMEEPIRLTQSWSIDWFTLSDHGPLLRN